MHAVEAREQEAAEEFGLVRCQSLERLTIGLIALDDCEVVTDTSERSSKNAMPGFGGFETRDRYQHPPAQRSRDDANTARDSYRPPSSYRPDDSSRNGSREYSSDSRPRGNGDGHQNRNAEASGSGWNGASRYQGSPAEATHGNKRARQVSDGRMFGDQGMRRYEDHHGRQSAADRLPSSSGSHLSKHDEGRNISAVHPSRIQNIDRSASFPNSTQPQHPRHTGKRYTGQPSSSEAGKGSSFSGLSNLPPPTNGSFHPSSSVATAAKPDERSSSRPTPVQAGQFRPPVKGKNGPGPMLGTYAGRSTSDAGNRNGNNGATGKSKDRGTGANPVPMPTASSFGIPRPGAHAANKKRREAEREAMMNVPPILKPDQSRVGLPILPPGARPERMDRKYRGAGLPNRPGWVDGAGSSDGAAAKPFKGFKVDFDEFASDEEGDSDGRREGGSDDDDSAGRLVFEYHPKIGGQPAASPPKRETLGPEPETERNGDAAQSVTYTYQDGDTESEEEEPIEIRPPRKPTPEIFTLDDESDYDPDGADNVGVLRQRMDRERRTSADHDNGEPLDGGRTGDVEDASMGDAASLDFATTQAAPVSLHPSGSIASTEIRSSPSEPFGGYPGPAPSAPNGTEIRGRPRSRSRSDTPPRRKIKWPTRSVEQVKEATEALNPTAAELAERQRIADEAAAEEQARQDKIAKDAARRKERKRKRDEFEKRDRDRAAKEESRRIQEANERDARRALERQRYHEQEEGLINQPLTEDAMPKQPKMCKSQKKQRNHEQEHGLINQPLTEDAMPTQPKMSKSQKKRARRTPRESDALADKAEANSNNVERGPSQGEPIAIARNGHDASTLQEREMSGRQSQRTAHDPISENGPGKPDHISQAQVDRHSSPDFATPLTPPNRKAHLPLIDTSPSSSTPAADPSTSIGDPTAAPGSKLAAAQSAPVFVPGRDIKPSRAELDRISPPTADQAIPDSERDTGVLFFRKNEVPTLCWTTDWPVRSKTRGDYVKRRKEELHKEGKRIIFRRWRGDGLGLEWVRVGSQADRDAIAAEARTAGTTGLEVNANAGAPSDAASVTAPAAPSTAAEARDVKPTAAELSRHDRSKAGSNGNTATLNASDAAQPPRRAAKGSEEMRFDDGRKEDCTASSAATNTAFTSIARDTSQHRTASPTTSVGGSMPPDADEDDPTLASLKASCLELARQLELHYESEEMGAYTAPVIGRRLLADLNRATDAYKAAKRARALQSAQQASNSPG